MQFFDFKTDFDLLTFWRNFFVGDFRWFLKKIAAVQQLKISSLPSVPNILEKNKLM